MLLINEKRLIENFLQLTSINSPSKNERQLADFLKMYLESLNLQVFEDQAGEKVGGNCGNLYCKIPASNSNYIPIAFFAHLDTIKDTMGIKVKVGEYWIETDGSTILGADDKVGIVLMLELVHQIKEHGIEHGGIELIFTVAEESGLEGAKSFDVNQLEAKLGFVLDSGDKVGTYVVQAPAEYHITIKVYGKSAHAGVEPEKGVNAIYLAAQALNAVPMGRLDSNSTFNIGLISGGESTNIVPDFVELKGELRSIDQQKLDSYLREIKGKFENKVKNFGGKSHFKYEKTYSSFDISNNETLEKILSLATRKIGIKAEAVPRGGASDANILNENGLITTNLGLGMQEEHTTKEKIALSDLFNGARLVRAIIEILPQLVDD